MNFEVLQINCDYGINGFFMQEADWKSAAVCGTNRIYAPIHSHGEEMTISFSNMNEEGVTYKIKYESVPFKMPNAVSISDLNPSADLSQFYTIGYTSVPRFELTVEEDPLPPSGEILESSFTGQRVFRPIDQQTKGIIPFGKKNSRSDVTIKGDSTFADLLSKTWMQVIIIAVLGGLLTCGCALIYYFKKSQKSNENASQREPRVHRFSS